MSILTPSPCSIEINLAAQAFTMQVINGYNFSSDKPDFDTPLHIVGAAKAGETHYTVTNGSSHKPVLSSPLNEMIASNRAKRVFNPLMATLETRMA